MSWLPALRTHRLTRALGAAADGATDVLQPLLVVARGLLRLGRSARAWWGRTPSDRRGPAVFLGAACALVVALTPYGPWLAVGALVCAAAWTGREAAEEAPTGPTAEQCDRLQALYDAVAPCFCTEDDPHPQPLYTPDGTWEQAFVAHAFAPNERLEHVELRYPPYFPDTDAAARGRVQQVLATKAGRDREYRFDWDEEHNRLRMTVREALPHPVDAQRFVTAPTESVLGFTDPESTARRLPVVVDGQPCELPPVVWRTGPASTESHLLVVGPPGSGTSNLLRSLALQALAHSDLIVVDGTGEGAYSFLSGRPGVLAVETSPTGAHTALQWAAHETSRRLHTPAELSQSRPLWVIVDRPTLLSHLAHDQGHCDPQDLLETPLRHGRAARVTVALADQLPEAEEGLSATVRSRTRAKVVLGQVGSIDGDRINPVLGTAPAQPGQGHVRLGDGPTHRIVVPHTPDPQNPATSPALRTAVEELLPAVPEPDATPVTNV
ncbi:hypothetical protein [Streptomyces sp. XM4193]|uniref:hypothetical protein n=1 Tax=Streptomyces sp. XM4193 TaxID=2929782 RepID=UPI001FFAC3BA|nr:hypothetical protein [Streptomyces sp. XM4193]